MSMAVIEVRDKKSFKYGDLNDWLKKNHIVIQIIGQNVKKADFNRLELWMRKKNKKKQRM